MDGDCSDIAERVRQALLSALKVEPYENGCEVSLPFLDQFNDPLKVYVYREGPRIVFTDYGTALDRLSEAGVDMGSSRRESIFVGILEANGVEDRNGVLRAHVPVDRIDDFGHRFRLFVHALSEVSGMEILGEPRIGLDFEEVVADYLKVREVPYHPHVQISAHLIDKVTVNFVLYDQVIMDSIHAAEVASANQALNRIIVDYGSIRRAHPQEYRLAVVYNDESAVDQSHRFKLLPDILDIDPIPWSERDERFEAIAESVGR
jgi:hypothetical protein